MPITETSHPTHYWHALDDGRVQCDLCPRTCRLKPGQRGLCFVRKNEDNAVVLTSYGRSSGFCIDPIEKKPLNHFLPGSSVLSFGTAGCNLACKFCQNWDMSKSRELDTLMAAATPQHIARIAQQQGARSVAFTYNDPVIFLEYAIDTAIACRQLGVKTVAVTAGYICDQPRVEFFKYMDAVNVDLKAFTEHFYTHVTGSHLQPVLDTLIYIHQQTDCWLEITTLLIPDKNDTDQEIDAMTKWIAEHLGLNIPLHFSAFHPDWKMMDVPPTPPASLIRARQIAIDNGLNYVYTGNVHDTQGDTTHCAHCNAPLIVRDWYELKQWNLTKTGHCPECGTACHGVFEAQPGNWGSKRLPIQMTA